MVQPFASVTVTVYTPVEETASGFAVEAPGDQLKVYPLSNAYKLIVFNITPFVSHKTKSGVLIDATG